MVASPILTPAEQLLSQFYAWERRGRGWMQFPHPVRLEPPFIPFPGHFLPLPTRLDDGQRSTILSSLTNAVSGLFSSQRVQRVPPSPKEEELDIVVPPERIELLIEFPKVATPDVETFEQFLVCAGACRHPLVFELLGGDSTVRVQLAAEGDDAKRVHELLTAHFPGVIVTPAVDRLEKQLLEAREGSAIVAEFGLSQEFMLPLATHRDLDRDPYVPLFAALRSVEGGEAAVFQVILEKVRRPWTNSIVRAVTAPDGSSFFDDAPEFLKLSREKTAKPLFAVVVRIAALAGAEERTLEIAQAVATALEAFARPDGNGLIPLDNGEYRDEEHLDDLVHRASTRCGMILNAEELASIVHIPTADVSQRLWRRLSTRSKAAPTSAVGHGLVLGTNNHHGQSMPVTMTTDQRMRHMHVIGASGTGKSTFLLNCILQDIQAGHGIGVLDPHGDLIEEVMARIPESRIKDVVLVDPSDEEYAVGFNILSAHSDLEKTLLASDLVGIFRRFSESWGDQMGSVLSNAVLAFLESTRGGTLADLRRFLIEPTFRKDFLSTVTDSHVLYYWLKEFSLLSGRPQAPLLTRLDTFLRPKPVRYMVSQKENKLDFSNIMDSGKIFLAKLAQGAIGEENAFLLGSLFVSKFHQLTLGRQSQSESSRRPFFLYCDEFGGYVTPSMAKLLSGARKFRLGLILSHQDLQQLHDEDVESAILSNAGTRVCFRVGEKDAKTLAQGFASFLPEDFANLATGEALCRILRSEDDCNLTTTMVAEVAQEEAVAVRQKIVAHTRLKYATPRKTIEEQAARDRGDMPIPLGPAAATAIGNGNGHAKKEDERAGNGHAAMRADLAQPVEAERPELPTSPIPVPKPRKAKMPATVAPMGKGGPRHMYLQHMMAQCGQERGWLATIEAPVKGGSVDVVLERGDRKIALEISVTSTVELEMGNLRKCITAGFSEIVMVCDERKTLVGLAKAAAQEISADTLKAVRILAPQELFLDATLLAEARMEEERVVRGYKVKVRRELPETGGMEGRRRVIAEVLAKVMRK